MYTYRNRTLLTNNYKNNNGSSNTTTEKTPGILYFSKCNSFHTSKERSTDALIYYNIHLMHIHLRRNTLKQENSYSCGQLMK